MNSLNFMMYAKNEKSFSITEGKFWNAFKNVVLETLEFFVPKEKYPVVVKGMLDAEGRISTLTITEETEHIEVNYPEYVEGGNYSFRSVVFLKYVGENIAQRTMLNGKEFQAILYAPDGKVEYQISGAFKSVNSISKKEQIEKTVVKMKHFFTLPAEYELDELLNTVLKSLQVVNLQEISKLVLPDNLKIENGKITDALVLGNGFCVFLSKEERSVKYVSKGFSVEEYPDIQRRSMFYIKYDSFDTQVLAELYEEAIKQITALLQTVAQFNNHNM